MYFHATNKCNNFHMIKRPQTSFLYQVERQEQCHNHRQCIVISGKSGMNQSGKTTMLARAHIARCKKVPKKYSKGTKKVPKSTQKVPKSSQKYQEVAPKYEVGLRTDQSGSNKAGSKHPLSHLLPSAASLTVHCVDTVDITQNFGLQQSKLLCTA